MAEELVSMVTVVSLLVTALYAVAGVVLVMLFAKKFPLEEKLILMWLVFDVLIHLTLEGPFVVLSLGGTVLESDHFTALVWKEYAKADYRWGVSDPTVVSLEILTTTIVEVIAIVLVYAILKNKYYRHFLQITLCVCELYGANHADPDEMQHYAAFHLSLLFASVLVDFQYTKSKREDWSVVNHVRTIIQCPQIPGNSTCTKAFIVGWMTFCPEWLTESKNLRTDNFLYLWVYLVFFNGLWVIIPLYMLWQSWREMKMYLGNGEVEINLMEDRKVESKTYNIRTRSKGKKQK